MLYFVLVDWLYIIFTVFGVFTVSYIGYLCILDFSISNMFNSCIMLIDTHFWTSLGLLAVALVAFIMYNKHKKEEEERLREETELSEQIDYIDEAVVDDHMTAALPLKHEPYMKTRDAYLINCTQSEIENESDLNNSITSNNYYNSPKVIQEPAKSFK